jgi:uncharacterized Zn-binding protein involved in type VI secretion
MKTTKPIAAQGDETMKPKARSAFWAVMLAALAISAVFAGSAGASPIWKFEAKELTGSETIMGGAVESSMTIPGLTTKCANFLYKVKISNSAGTGKGEITEVPLYECTTDSKACTVESIGAELLPWPAKLTTVSTSNYIVIEGVKVAILYAGKECALGGTLASVKGTAGGLIDNVTETATFNAASFSATGTVLKALGSPIEWKGVFPTEAFEWHREQPLTVS